MSGYFQKIQSSGHISVILTLVVKKSLLYTVLKMGTRNTDFVVIFMIETKYSFISLETKRPRQMISGTYSYGINIPLGKGIESESLLLELKNTTVVSPREPITNPCLLPRTNTHSIQQYLPILWLQDNSTVKHFDLCSPPLSYKSLAQRHLCCLKLDQKCSL